MPGSAEESAPACSHVDSESAAIAAFQQISRISVAAVLEPAGAAELSWDDVANLSDGEAYSLLFPGRGEHKRCPSSPTGPRCIGRWSGSG